MGCFVNTMISGAEDYAIGPMRKKKKGVLKKNLSGARGSIDV